MFREYLSETREDLEKGDRELKLGFSEGRERSFIKERKG